VSERTKVVERAAVAYAALAELAETVEDEWQYVTDLTDAYLPSIRALAAGPAVTREVVEAVDEAIAEIELIADPHKAIDWLSTFPHLVALALGGDVDAPADPGAGSGAASGPESDPDDDSPFRILRGGR
jgi:hypothetical protein